jgi:DNA-binding response OmpR family regulator
MSLSVLVVDDNDMNLALVSKILEMAGYQVRVACNAQDAIESIQKDMPNLAILDVMMPDMDGFELCRKLRQPPNNVIVPIIMLTAMSSPTEKQLAKEAGANDIWSKPFDMDLFLKRVGKLLKKATRPF